ncbi:acyltransferase [Rhizobium sp. BG4]|nr:acyltransferase [Rhizobium sp. BG4]
MPVAHTFDKGMDTRLAGIEVAGSTCAMAFPGIELLRVIGIFAVVIIHANAVGLFGEWKTTGFVLDELCRFAVPCFFVVSGFFWKTEAIERPWRAIGALAAKLLPLYAFWLLFYFAAEFSELFYPRLYGRDFIVALVPFSGGPGFHLWFLPALFIGVSLCWLSLRYVGAGLTVAACVLLYLAGVIFGTYGDLIGIHLPLVAYRNGIFEAPLFLLSGFMLRRYLPRFTTAQFALLGLAGLALHLAEGFAVSTSSLGHDYSFGTIAAAIGITGLATRLSHARDYGWGRDVLGAYLIHLFILKTVAAHLPVSGPLWALSIAAIVAAVSLGLSRLFKQTPVSRRLVALS